MHYFTKQIDRAILHKNGTKTTKYNQQELKQVDNTRSTRPQTHWKPKSQSQRVEDEINKIVGCAGSKIAG